MKILVTGFDPFGGDAINPAIEAVKLLPNTIKDAEIIKVEIPTVFHKSGDVLLDAMRTHEPDMVLAIGQAGGRSGLTPERVAINEDDARIPDNEGNQPIDVVIHEDGAPAYFSTLPIKAMTQAIRDAGLPASVSNTAGTFVCNHIMYQALYYAHKEFPKTKAGFMHIPFMTEQVVDRPDQPSMSLQDMSRGIEVAIEAMIDFKDKEDIKMVGGKTH
ncbi:pyroglutamyl-peptidase I [Dolosicoccus paucivorans]|uniref:Pyrrolidone-carboxylate peptidase n=1 Tax=Dolosicoccus paucivorans TaxID=84521 RepID=A0A1G8N2B8_9LACT|nr:pyroglutamyl-peptidase I [Dolosicoccus paucivorans]PMB84365.1 pyroglutamyl-peptidase I [Dolosicoccus paucivorans]PMC58114.1 pyroglutamyl-peptidase I [Dolosicoccus paucivorans]SDI74334.1 pyroglutamyl-peptidase [Dolosicoccus paucivorans]